MISLVSWMQVEPSDGDSGTPGAPAGHFSTWQHQCHFLLAWNKTTKLQLTCLCNDFSSLAAALFACRLCATDKLLLSIYPQCELGSRLPCNCLFWASCQKSSLAPGSRGMGALLTFCTGELSWWTWNIPLLPKEKLEWTPPQNMQRWSVKVFLLVHFFLIAAIVCDRTQSLSQEKAPYVSPQNIMPIFLQQWKNSPTLTSPSSQEALPHSPHL